MRILKIVCLLLAFFPVLARSAEADALLRIQIWGAPWDDRFDVTLASDGTLRASLAGLEKNEAISIALSPDETSTLHKLAIRAVSDSTSANCKSVVDGTSARLTVTVGTTQVVHECLATSVWPPIGSGAEVLVKAINTKLPKTIQLY